MAEVVAGPVLPTLLCCIADQRADDAAERSGTIALFERRPAAYTLINGGYWMVAFAVMGAIIGARR